MATTQDDTSNRLGDTMTAIRAVPPSTRVGSIPPSSIVADLPANEGRQPLTDDKAVLAEIAAGRGLLAAFGKLKGSDLVRVFEMMEGGKELYDAFQRAERLAIERRMRDGNRP